MKLLSLGLVPQILIGVVLGVIVALLLQLAAVVQLSLSHDDRYVFVASACVGAWTPVLVSLYRTFCALRHQPRALML